MILHLHTRTRSIPKLLASAVMECSNNDWDLQAVVRSCGTAAAACGSGGSSEAPAAAAEARRGIHVGRAAAAAPEFLVGRPVRPAAALRDLDYLGSDHELAPFSITPSGERGAPPLDHEVLISFPAASTSGQQLLRPRKQPGGRKPGVRTPRPKRR